MNTDGGSEVLSAPWRSILGTLASIACAAWLIRDVELGRVLALLSAADPWFVGLSLTASLAVYVVTAMRWRLLFAPLQRPSLRDLFGALMLAQLVNTLLPARLGPLARAYALRGREGMGATYVLSTVVVEKLVEGVTLLPFLLILPLFAPFPAWLKRPATLSGMLSILGVIAAVGIWRWHERLIVGADRFICRLPEGVSGRFLRSLRSTRDRWSQWLGDGVGWRVWGWSLAVWTATVGLDYLVFLALDVPVPFSAALWLLVVLQIGGRLPSAPAGIGVFHYLAVMTLSLFSVDRTVALGYGVLLHALIYLPASLLGAFYLWRGSRALREVWALGQEA